jgi:hypothetical protein
MALSYEAVHWGDRPDGTMTLDVFTGPGGIVGRLTAISYAARKDGLSEVYRHDMKSRPELICGRKKGTTRTSSPPRSGTILLGRAIDAELVGGERVLFSGVWIITDTEGQRIWLATPDRAPVQVTDGPTVTAHGIEH